MITPPTIAWGVGTSDKINKARIGARGISKIESNAVSADGRRRAPSDKVTEATAKTNPNRAKNGN
jgi:hypothetical protein